MDQAIAIPQEMKRHELPISKTDTVIFWGKLLGETDTDTGDRLRWAELRLYKIIDTDPAHDDSLLDENRGMYGKQMWLLYTIGHSVVYHAPGSSCKKGVRVSAADFPSRSGKADELEPCEDCNPGDWRDDPGFFKLEIPWYTYIPCQSAPKVIRSLYREPRCSSCRDKPHENRRCHCGCDHYTEAPRMLSVPGQALIEQVSMIDPEIAAASSETRRL